MYFFIRKNIVFIRVMSVIACCLQGVAGAQQESFTGYRGAFVFPLVKKNNKTYVLVGRESGGKDKGSYCIPGGSSGWWFLRDTHPLKTASREFIEETLTSLDYYTVRTTIESYMKHCFVDVFHDKKIVSYVVPFQEAIINDIMKNFVARRKATWFWQYYYREMDCFALIELNTLIAACKKHHRGQRCIVKGLLYNGDSGQYNELDLIIRPILRLIVAKHAKDLRSCI